MRQLSSWSTGIVILNESVAKVRLRCCQPHQNGMVGVGASLNVSSGKAVSEWAWEWLVWTSNGMGGVDTVRAAQSVSNHNNVVCLDQLVHVAVVIVNCWHHHLERGCAEGESGVWLASLRRHNGSQSKFGWGWLSRVGITPENKQFQLY
jgi:hypothetical protein